MAKYRKKPVVVEAVRWVGTAENVREMNEFIGKNLKTVNGAIEIETLEGVMLCNDGDFLIKGVAGELYPCKPGIFAEIYELVE